MKKNFISNKDETVRMFKSDFMESLSKVHWTVPLIVFVPVIIFFIYRSFFVLQNSGSVFILLLIAGLFFWSLTEYSLHRYVFHYEAKSEIGKKMHFIFHGVHHDYPKDSKRLVMPPSVSLPLATGFYFLFDYILYPYMVPGFFAGFITGYVFYDTTHYAIHHFNMKSKFWLAIKNHHMRHHYHDPDNGYGVSQPFWDYIFGTMFKKKTSETVENA